MKFRFLKKALNALPKLSKDSLLDLCKDLIYEKYYLLQINDNNPIAICLFSEENTSIFQNSQFSQLIKDIPDLLENLNNNGIYCTLDIYKNDRIFNITHSTFDLYKITYITELTDFLSDHLESKTNKSLSALEILAANISHEIKNPLSAIDIHTQLLQYKINNKKLIVPQEIEQYLDIVQQESDRLLKILDMFLHMTRKSDPKLEFIEVSQVIYQVYKLLEVELQQNNISLNIHSDFIPKIFSAPHILQQIILDLLRNSIESFKDNNKQIQISITESNTKSHIIISIDDSGIGIPKELKYKIFDPYFTTKKNGTGLGLTLVKKMVEELNGTITISQSKELGGTKITLSFPISTGSQKLLS